MNPAHIIELDGIDYRYRSAPRPALAGVTLRFGRGAVVGIVGPNGSGKTTLFRLLLGLMRPTAGRVSIEGIRPATYRTQRGVGYLPEAITLPARLKVGELATYAACLSRLRGAAARSAIQRLMDELEFSDKAADLIGTLSHGYRQRVGLLVALLGDPDLLLLDEPANGLDPHSIGVLRSQLRALKRRGKTIIVSSHNLLELQRTYDEVILLRDGEVLGRSRRDDLLARPDVWVVQLGSRMEDVKAAHTLGAEMGGVKLAADEMAFSVERSAREYAARLDHAECVERRAFDLEYLFHSLLQRHPE